MGRTKYIKILPRQPPICASECALLKTSPMKYINRFLGPITARIWALKSDFSLFDASFHIPPSFPETYAPCYITSCQRTISLSKHISRLQEESRERERVVLRERGPKRERKRGRKEGEREGEIERGLKIERYRFLE